MGDNPGGEGSDSSRKDPSVPHPLPLACQSQGLDHPHPARSLPSPNSATHTCHSQHQRPSDTAPSGPELTVVSACPSQPQGHHDEAPVRCGSDCVSVGQNLPDEETVSPDHKVYDGQGRNILYVTAYHSDSSHAGNHQPLCCSDEVKFRAGRECGHPSIEDAVTHKQGNSTMLEGVIGCLPSSPKLERPGSPPEHPPLPLNKGSASHCPQSINTDHCPQSINTDHCPQSVNNDHCPQSINTDHCPQSVNNDHCPQSINTDHCPQSINTDHCSQSFNINQYSQSSHQSSPDMLNVPVSSRVFSTHVIDVSKVPGHLASPPSAQSSSSDYSNHMYAHHRECALPDDTQSDSQSDTQKLDCEVTDQSNLLPSKSDKGNLPAQEEESQPSSPAPCVTSNPTAENQPFVVTPNVCSDSDTDEYTEADYKPILENLAAKRRQTRNTAAQNQKKTSSKKGRTNVIRKSQRNKVKVVKGESGDNSGSEYNPTSCDRTAPAKERTPERVLPMRGKRRSVPASFAEYYNDSDDSIPDRLPAPSSAKVKKHDADSNNYQPKKSSSGNPVAAAKKHGSKILTKKGTSNKTCPECHKTFTRADSLTVHMRVHTGDRPFSCQQCDATYKVSSHLRNHVRSKHSDVKAYKCHNCAKAFSTSRAKRRHEKICGTDFSERVKHQCPRCQKLFVTEEGYERHRTQDACVVGDNSVSVGGGDNDDDHVIDTAGEASTKYEGTVFRCSHCPKAFVEAAGLDTHQRFLCGKGPGLGAGPYTCSQCGQELPRWNRFVAHCRRHTGDKPHVCSHCGARFFDKDCLRKHVSRHKENTSVKYKRKTPVKCSLCDKQFTVKRTLAMHIMRVHCGMKPYKCNECDSDFASAKLLSTHIRRVHRKEKRFKCQICSRAFFESQAWMKHMILHAGNRPPRIRGPVHKYPCRLCGKSYNMRLMRMHVEEDHPGVPLSQAVSKAMVTCSLCNKEFSDPSSLKMHMLRHTGRKDFKCTHCDMHFITPAAMQLHQRKHSTDRPYACQDCGQTFRWRASLRDHRMHLHNPDLDPPDDHGRRFACKECGQRFKRYNTLRTHMIRHRGVMPCICSECGKGFTDNTRLKIHMSCHSGSSGGDRPFICETCGAGFYYSFLLKRHIQSRHHPSPWLCSMCGRSLCSKDALKRHIQHHADSPDGKVRVGGNRGRPRKYCDHDQSLDEVPKAATETTEPKVKGKRGRKSKKTIAQTMEQSEDEGVCRKFPREEVCNSVEPSNLPDSRISIPEPGKSMVDAGSGNVVDHRHVLEAGTIVETTHSVENTRHELETSTNIATNCYVENNAATDSRPATGPRHMFEATSSQDSRIVMEPRNMIMNPSNLTEPAIPMEPNNAMESKNTTMEPRNLMPSSRTAMEPDNAKEQRSLDPRRNTIEPGNSLEPRNIIDPWRNAVEPIIDSRRNAVDSSYVAMQHGHYVDLGRLAVQPGNLAMEHRNLMYPVRRNNSVEPGASIPVEATALIDPGSNMTEVQARTAVEPRTPLPRDKEQARNSMRSETTDPRNSSRVEARTVIELGTSDTRHRLEARNAVELGTPDSRHRVQPSNAVELGTIDPRNSSIVEARTSVEPGTSDPRHRLEARNTLEPRRTTLEPLQEPGKEQVMSSGGTFVELTRASPIMHLNNHVTYAQHNFGYSPVSYMGNPLLWPKTQDH